jgi:hypothetical protein
VHTAVDLESRCIEKPAIQQRLQTGFVEWVRSFVDSCHFLNNALSYLVRSGIRRGVEESRVFNRPSQSQFDSHAIQIKVTIR